MEIGRVTAGNPAQRRHGMRTMTLTDLYRDAIVASDGIPLHFGDEQREYHAALEQAVVMDRSHEGRFEISGNDRLSILHRISTNDLLTLDADEGRPTLFT